MLVEVVVVVLVDVVVELVDEVVAVVNTDEVDVDEVVSEIAFPMISLTCTSSH